MSVLRGVKRSAAGGRGDNALRSGDSEDEVVARRIPGRRCCWVGVVIVVEEGEGEMEMVGVGVVNAVGKDSYSGSSSMASSGTEWIMEGIDCCLGVGALDFGEHSNSEMEEDRVASSLFSVLPDSEVEILHDCDALAAVVRLLLGVATGVVGVSRHEFWRLVLKGRELRGDPGLDRGGDKGREFEAHEAGLRKES